MSLNICKNECVLLNNTSQELTLSYSWKQLGYGTRVECDFVLFFLKDNKILENIGMVYFSTPESPYAKIIDRVRGKDSQTYKSLILKLSEATEACDNIKVYACIYFADIRAQHFGLINDFKFSMQDQNNEIICTYNLNDEKQYGKISILVGEFQCKESVWSFIARGEATRDNLQEIASLYGC